MALFGGARDISLFRHLNRELMADVITQQCSFYKFKLEETKVNLYGEAAGEKYFDGPFLFNCLLLRQPEAYAEGDSGIGYAQNIRFSFLRDDLVDASVVMEPGDIIMYYESYFEVDSVKDNQLFVGKDPRYPYSQNPLNPGLDNFGSNISIICTSHYTPADKVQITRERL